LNAPGFQHITIIGGITLGFEHLYPGSAADQSRTPRHGIHGRGLESRRIELGLSRQLRNPTCDKKSEDKNKR